MSYSMIIYSHYTIPTLAFASSNILNEYLHFYNGYIVRRCDRKYMCVIVRHELLKEHFQRRIDQKEDGRDMGVNNPEWFPAGVSPSRFPWEGEGEEFEGMSVAEEVQEYQMSWMDSQQLSARELHRAAAGIKRCVSDSL